MVDMIKNKEYTWEELKSLVQNWNKESLDSNSMSSYRLCTDNDGYANKNLEKFFKDSEKDVDR